MKSTAMGLLGHNSASFGQAITAELNAYLSEDRVEFKHMDLHLGDYITGTLSMSAEEEGIYIRFLTRLYKSGKPFEDNDREMAHLMCLDMRVWKRIKASLVGRGKIMIRSGGLTNVRFEKERKKRAEFLQKSAEAAKKRWGNVGQKDSTSGELPANLGGTSAGIPGKLSPKKDNKPLKNNDLKVNTHMLPIPIPIPLQEREERILSENELSDPPPKKPHGVVQQAVDLYNAIAERRGLATVRAISPARAQAISLRVKEVGGIEGFKRAMQNLDTSAFLHGKNDRGWRADFDFVCQAKSFHRLHEGGYGNGAHAENPPGAPQNSHEPDWARRERENRERINKGKAELAARRAAEGQS